MSWGMYDIRLDSYGPPMEPPDDYYFQPREELDDEHEEDTETDDERTDRPGAKPGHSGDCLE